MGVVGMSLNDARRLTPAEFALVHEKWLETRELDYRAGWEQARFIACCAMTPYSKKRLKPSDLVVFGWEKKETPETAACTMEDFERMAKKYG